MESDLNTAIARELTRHLTSPDFAEELAEVAVLWDSPSWRRNIADWVAREFETVKDLDDDGVILPLVVKFSGLSLSSVTRALDWEKLEKATRRAVRRYEPDAEAEIR